MVRCAALALCFGCFLFSILIDNSVSQQKRDKPRFPPSPHVAPTEALKPDAQRKKFHLPPGFEIQLVAAEPQVKNPINIAFDAKGRLWVTMSSEYPFPNHRDKTADTLKVFEDFAANGWARKVTTFADNLNIPIGVLPLADAKSAIVFSIPNVWYMADTDRDGKADVKKVLLKHYGFRDTHGMTGEFQWGIDGWVYACHGFANDSTVTGTDGSTIKMTSGNTYRFKPDGSRVEHFTHGQVNPFGLSFDPLGNLYSVDCHSRPIYQLLRGAYYPSFGRPHDGIGFGPEMMTHSHNSTALCGITYYAADHFPPEFRDNIFIGNVTSNQVNRDSLQRVGSTYKAVPQPDFIRCDDPWFRPVDIKLGPDGALYIADFYNRIIGHYEVPLDHPGRDRDHGRIWRVVYRGKEGKGQAKPPRRDWTTAKIEELVRDLAHPNLSVRTFATHQLAARGEEAVAAVRRTVVAPVNAAQQAHALWVLERHGALTDDLLRAAATAQDAVVRVHALRVLAERDRLSPPLRELTVERLRDADAFVQRTAAQVLANHPSAVNLRPLLELRHHAPADDTHLVHVVRMAIRDQLKGKGVWSEVAEGKWSGDDIRAIGDVSLSLHGPEAARFLTDHFHQLDLRRAEFARHVARYGDGETRHKLYARLAGKDYAKAPLLQAAMLKAIVEGTQERGAPLDASAEQWAKRLTDELLGGPRAWALSGVELAGLMRMSAAEAKLAEFLGRAGDDEELRSRSAESLLKINPTKHAPAVGRILARGSEAVPLRKALAQALAQANTTETRRELVKGLESAPGPLQAEIAAALAASRQGADELLDAVAAGKASARLLREKNVEQRLRQANPPGLSARLEKLTSGLPAVDAQIVDLLRRRSAGFAKANADHTVGAKLFEKSCASCHQINNRGAKLAPQLDGIGLRGVDRLLEDILDPSRNVDQQFRATTIYFKNGQVFTGLFVKQEGNVLVLADQEGKERRFAQDEVQSRVVSPMSPMPANLDEQLGEQNLYHLLAFLLRQQQSKSGDDQ